MDSQAVSRRPPRTHCPLPNEVLHLIFSEFLITLNPDPRQGLFGIIRWTLGRYRDLSNICKASKQLNAVAQPLLYRFLLTFPYHKGVDKALGSMSNHPHLGGLVEIFDLRYTLDTLRWDSRHGEWFEQARPHLNLPPELADQIESVLSETLNHYTMEARDALTAFWLSLMPNLRKLSLAMMDETDLTSALFKHAVEPTETALTRTPPFSSLQEVTFTQAPYKSEKSIHITAIEALFKLPSLTTLRTSGIPWNRSEHDEPFLLPDVDSSLQHLESKSSRMRPETLKSILMACRGLRTLRLDIAMDTYPNIFPDSYDFGTILRNHGQNLERISLAFHFKGRRNRMGDWLTGEEYLTRNIGDLRCLSKLKHFRLNLPAFDDDMYRSSRPYGPLTPLMDLTEMLPRSLETLALRCGFCDKKALVENLSGLLVAKDTQPELRCVMLSNEIKLKTDLTELGWNWKMAETTHEGWKWRINDVNRCR
ncbi:hypothetical protein Neosp_002867 [[Neocosmospora] mangrovei]